MRILLTGATGFIGSHLVPILVGAGYQVVGLCRAEAGADALVRAGAEAFRGDINDLDRLRVATEGADGVVHTAFNHDFANLKQHSEEDRRVIAALGDALAGSGRPLVITSGTGLARPQPGELAVETDPSVASTEFARAATEEAAEALVGNGGRVMVIRLPQVHDTRHQGRIAQHIALARQKGTVAYIGDGANRLPAAHVSDVVGLYLRVLENGQPGARYHAVAEQGVAMRDIAEVIGAGLNLPAVSISPDEATGYFGWLATLAAADLAASGAMTREQLEWHPRGPGLLKDLSNTDFHAA